MKFNPGSLSYILPLASIVASLAFGASTTPVGYNMVTTVAGSDTFLGVPFHQDYVDAGFIFSAAIVNGPQGIGSVTVSNAGWGVNAFGSAAQSNRHYLLVKSGDRAGFWYQILSNTSTTLTVDTANDPNFVSVGRSGGVAVTTNTFEILPFWTLDRLFPAGQGLNASSSLSAPQGDLLFFITPGGDEGFASSGRSGGVEARADLAFFYYGGGDTNPANSGVVPGFYLRGAVAEGLKGETALAPDTMFILRNQTATNGKVIFFGNVPTSPKASVLALSTTGQTEDNFFGNPYPVDLSLYDLGLPESGFFQASTSLASPNGDFVLIYNRLLPNQTGKVNRPADDVYFYYAGGEPRASYAGFQPGWYNGNRVRQGPLAASVKTIPASSGFAIRKFTGSAGSEAFTAEVPYTLD